MSVDTETPNDPEQRITLIAAPGLVYLVDKTRNETICIFTPEIAEALGRNLPRMAVQAKMLLANEALDEPEPEPGLALLDVLTPTDENWLADVIALAFEASRGF